MSLFVPMLMVFFLAFTMHIFHTYTYIMLFHRFSSYRLTPFLCVLWTYPSCIATFSYSFDETKLQNNKIHKQSLIRIFTLSTFPLPPLHCIFRPPHTLHHHSSTIKSTNKQYTRFYNNNKWHTELNWCDVQNFDILVSTLSSSFGEEWECNEKLLLYVWCCSLLFAISIKFLLFSYSHCALYVQMRRLNRFSSSRYSILFGENGWKTTGENC